MKFKLLSLCFLFVSLGTYTFAKNSLPAIDKNKAAQNIEELWAGYDPRAEPLEVKTIREWDEVCEGKQIKVQMLTFTVGTFKNQVSRISAYYAYPKNQAQTGGRLIQPKSMSAITSASLPMKKPQSLFTVQETTIGSSSRWRPGED